MNIEFTPLVLMRNKWEKISLNEFHIERLFILNFGIGFGTVVKQSHMWIIVLCICMDLWKRKSIFQLFGEKAQQTPKLFSLLHLYRMESEITELKIILLKEC